MWVSVLFYAHFLFNLYQLFNKDSFTIYESKKSIYTSIVAYTYFVQQCFNYKRT